jgi:hypothetical protein
VGQTGIAASSSFFLFLFSFNFRKKREGEGLGEVRPPMESVLHRA